MTWIHPHKSQQGDSIQCLQASGGMFDTAPLRNPALY